MKDIGYLLIRLERYSEKCVSERLDPDYARAVTELKQAFKDCIKELSRKRCHNVNVNGIDRIFKCSECGYGIMDIYISDEEKYPVEPRFCPNCGAVVEGVLNGC